MDPASTEARIKIFGIAVLIVGSTICSLPLHAFAASLSLLPSTVNVSVGETFTLGVYISSPNQAMNAASGDISFPSDKLQVLSVSKADSIIGLWIRDPSFTNSVEGGDVDFQGIVLNPGFIGSAGNLITITFQAVNAGDAPVTFLSGAVLANDGNGTNILNDLNSADVEVAPRKAIPPSSVQSALSGVSASTSPTSTADSSPAFGFVTSTPIVVPSSSGAIKYIPSSTKWKATALAMAEWGFIAVLGLLLLAGIIFLALYVVHRIRKWRVSSERNLLALEETLRNDLKRIEKELGAEKRSREDPVRKVIEHVKSDIKKDIGLIDDIEKK